jgi:hypothetical protein
MAGRYFALTRRRRWTRADVVGLDGEFGGLHLLGAEALHHTHAGDRLLDHRGELGLLGLHREDGRMDGLREAPGRPVDERQRRERHQRQQRIGDEQDHHDGAMSARFDSVSGIITTNTGPG